MEGAYDFSRHDPYNRQDRLRLQLALYRLSQTNNYRLRDLDLRRYDASLSRSDLEHSVRRDCHEKRGQLTRHMWAFWDPRHAVEEEDSATIAQKATASWEANFGSLADPGVQKGVQELADRLNASCDTYYAEQDDMERLRKAKMRLYERE